MNRSRENAGRCPLHHQHSRRGAVVVLMACLLVVLVAMVAFALDIGYICRVQAELQNAADAAALAGAHEALQAVVRGDTDAMEIADDTIDAARQTAQQLSAFNQAGGVSLSVLTNDIVVGYQQTPGPQPVTQWTSGDPVPNCVQVTTRRDTSANGSLPLIFAPILGTNSTNQTATATAAFDTGRYRVTGFNSSVGGPNAKLLPVTISIDTWNDYIQGGQSPDGIRHDNYTVETVLPNSTVEPPDNVQSGADHTPELVGVYPNPIQPGDFGLVQFNPNAPQGTGYTSDWILNGPSPTDLGGFGPQGFQATPASPGTLQAGTGWKTSLVNDFASIIGQPRAIPLYSSHTGSGSGGQFTIVGFAGVTVVHASGSGSNVNIVFQPTILIDSTATWDVTSTTVTEFVYPQLPIVLVR